MLWDYYEVTTGTKQCMEVGSGPYGSGSLGYGTHRLPLGGRVMECEVRLCP
jgi:hypothetical protein